MAFLKKNPLFFAFFFPAFMDGVATLAGQDKSYWITGAAHDASPAYYFLLASPLLFIAGSAIWFVLWYHIFKRLKNPIDLFLSLFFISAHSWGGTSWIWRIMKNFDIYQPDNQLSVMLAWCFVVIYFLLIAASSTYFIKYYFNSSNKSALK